MYYSSSKMTLTKKRIFVCVFFFFQNLNVQWDDIQFDQQELILELIQDKSHVECIKLICDMQSCSENMACEIYDKARSVSYIFFL